MDIIADAKAVQASHATMGKTFNDLLSHLENLQNQVKIVPRQLAQIAELKSQLAELKTQLTTANEKEKQLENQVKQLTEKVTTMQGHPDVVKATKEAKIKRAAELMKAALEAQNDSASDDKPVA